MTIKQIAEKAGTSRGTVDRVLNGRGNVNPELAKRILDIAERERYQPNQLAQALIRSRQHQGSNMCTVHIGIGHDDDLVIPQFGNIKIFMNTGTKCRDHRTDLRIAVNSIQSCFFYV